MTEAQGRPVPAFDFTGTVTEDGSFTVTRSLVLGQERPRAGGHTFYAQQQASVSGRFEQSGGQPRMDAAGTFAVTFREGSATGAVFTTCTLPFTSNSTRVSP